MNKVIGCILLLSAIAGCDLFEDEDLYHGVRIYKTKGDYFNLVDVGMKGDKVIRCSSFWNSKTQSMEHLTVRGNDTVCIHKYKLPNGYVMDGSANLNDVYLDITFKEQLYRELSGNHPGPLPLDTIKKYILDKDPYLEFYQNKTEVKRFYMEDSLEIRDIILNGEIDRYFERLK